MSKTTYPEPKSGSLLWFWILLGLIGLGALAWWLFVPRAGGADNYGATNELSTDSVSDRNTMVVFLPIGEIRTAPVDYMDRSVSGVAVVDEVVSDRTFYFRGEGGEEVLAVLDDGITTDAPLVPGHQVRVEGFVHGMEKLKDLAATMVGPAAVRKLQGEPAFIFVNEIEILDRDRALEPLGLAAIVAEPSNYFGQTVSGTVQVVRPDSDRGFFVTSNDGKGQMFAILSQELDTPDPRTDINAGQTIWVSGTLYDSAQHEQVAELAPVSAETKRLLQEQRVFLRVTAVQILSAGS